MRSVILVGLLAACGTNIRATVINPAPHPMHPRMAAQIELFTSGPPHDRPFVDFAYLEAEQQSGYSVDNTPEFFAALRKRAALMGCDALVIGSPTNATTVGIDLETPMNQKGIVATCIVYTDDPPGVAAR